MAATQVTYAAVNIAGPMILRQIVMYVARKHA